MISAEWMTYKLGDVAEITSSKRIYLSDYVKDGIPFYRSKEIIELFNKQSVTTELYITNEKFNEIKERFGAPQEGEMLLTSVGTIGIPYLVTEKDNFYFKDGNLTWFRNYRTDIINPKYLYFWIQSKIGKQAIEQSKIGSTQQAITIIALKKIQINLPPLSDQSRIASILSSLDDKIELNLQMNKTLEAIAQAIFKEWFENFRFPGFDGVLVDGLPKGWRKGHLSDILDLHYGKALKSEDRRKGSYPVIGSSGVVGLHDTFHVKGPGIVIGRKGTIGKVIWIDENFFPIDTTFFIKDLLGTSSLYYHFFLLRNQSFQKISSDSAVPGLNKNEALRNYAIVPQVEIVNRYNEIAKPLFERMNLINIENLTLTQLRDNILPKLMTGKIRVA